MEFSPKFIMIEASKHIWETFNDKVYVYTPSIIVNKTQNWVGILNPVDPI